MCKFIQNPIEPVRNFSFLQHVLHHGTTSYGAQFLMKSNTISIMIPTNSLIKID